MIKNILTALLFIVSSILYSQKATDVINKANSLVKVKKYESAFKELDKFDPDNKKPEIFLLKQDIVLNYFVMSMSHKMFSLKDIKPEEDIMDYRGKDGNSSAMMFDIEELLQQLIKDNPKDFRLNNALANYYYDAMLKYGENWSKSGGELKSLIEKNFKIAIENNAGDYMSYYSLGYLQIIDNKFKESIEYFAKSIELNSEYPTSNYNLALAYMYSEDGKNALKYALKALDLYKSDSYKSDAGRVVSQLYYEAGDNDNAIKYIEQADKIVPDNYHNLKLMLKLYTAKNHPDLNKALNSFFNLNPSNPEIYNDLEEIFYANKLGDKLVVFLNEKKNNKDFDDMTRGCVYFHVAKFSFFNGDKKNIKENALKAKGYFEKVLKKDHEVFALVEQLISKSDQ